MDVTFRVDGSSTIGGGHLYRCLTLADALAQEGATCTFLTGDESLAMLPDLSRHTILPADTQPYETDILVVDHYELDIGYETWWRGHARKVMVIDDLADRPHNCDILLDQTFRRHASAYEELVPPHCVLLLGTGYALLRPQFLAHQKQALTRRKKMGGKFERVFVSFGNIDACNLCALVAEALQGFEAPLHVDMVIEKNHPRLGHIQKTFEQSPHTLAIHHKVTDMAALMAAADIGLGAGGTTRWESCALALPVITYEVADNQTLILKNLTDAGAVIYMGHGHHGSAPVLARTFEHLRQNPDTLIKVQATARQICDGTGTHAVAQMLKKG